MAILDASADVDFAFLRAELDLSDSDLSKQMKALADAGYVKVAKTGLGRGGVTRFTATRAGRKALAAHVAALRRLLGPAGGL